MKNYQFILWAICLFVCQPFLSQNNCDPKGITTDPDNPVNTELPYYRNDFFDWRTEFFDVNSNFIGASQVYSPYSTNLNNNSNTLGLAVAKDYDPEDGWELMAWDMGFDEDNQPESPAAGNIHFILYNKYTSVLRIFVAGQDANAYNNAEIVLSIDQSSGPLGVQPSLLVDPTKFTGLDEHYSEPLKSVSSFLNGLVSNWFYADFFINFDPCVCNFESNMSFEVNMIDQAQLDISGDITGTIASVSGGSGTVENGKSFSVKDLIDGGKKVYEAYESGKKFTDKQEEVIEILNTPDNQLTAEQLEQREDFTAFQNLLDNDILEAGVAAFPYIKGALALVKFFTSNAESSSSSTKPQPMSVNTEINLSGTLTTSNPYITPTYFVPGSMNSDQQDNRYPYYNEVLGVFNITETPTVKLNKQTNASYDVGYNIWYDTYQGVFGNYWYTNYVITQSYEVEFNENLLKYYINPALNLDEEDVEILGSIFIETNKADLTASGIDKPRKPVTAESDIVPLNCLFSHNFSFGSYNSFDAEILTLNGTTTEYEFTDIQQNTWTGVNSYMPLNWDFLKPSSNPHGYGYTSSGGFITVPLMQDFEEITINLRIYLNITRPNGEHTLQVLTYPLDVTETTNITKPDFTNFPQLGLPWGTNPYNLYLENVVLTQDVYAYNITVGENVTAAPGYNINIVAGNEINVIPNAVIDPEIILTIDNSNNGGGYACYSSSPMPMQTETEMLAFCQSTTYQDIRTKTSPSIENPSQESETFEFTLYPNPTSENTYLSFELSKEEDIEIKIFDISGKLLNSSKQQSVSKGQHTVELQTSAYAPGYYVCQLSIGGVNKTKKIIVK